MEHYLNLFTDSTCNLVIDFANFIVFTLTVISKLQVSWTHHPLFICPIQETNQRLQFPCSVHMF